MADTDDPADAAARLEKALERIAALAGQAAPAEAPVQSGPVEPEAAVDMAAVAERLDALIARLRAVLVARPG